MRLLLADKQGRNSSTHQ